MWLRFLTIATRVFCIRAFNATSKDWFSQGLYHSISLPPSFLVLNLGFHILGAPMGSRSFIKSFVVEVLYEDLGTISNLPMFAYFQMTFEMFLLLCPTPWLFASYSVSISRYFATLH
jgi:hypothetical protein